MSEEAVRFGLAMLTITLPASCALAWALTTWLDHRTRRVLNRRQDAAPSHLARYYQGRSEARRAEAANWDHAYAEAMGWPLSTQERQLAAGLQPDGVMGPLTVAAWTTRSDVHRCVREIEQNAV